MELLVLIEITTGKRRPQNNVSCLLVNAMLGFVNSQACTGGTEYEADDNGNKP